LFHIAEASVTSAAVATMGGRGEDEGKGVEEEVEEECGKFQIHNSTKFNHGSASRDLRDVRDAGGTCSICPAFLIDGRGST